MTRLKSEKFDDGHHIAVLRGQRKMPFTMMKRSLVARSSYLAKKIEERLKLGKEVSFLEEELKSIVQLVEEREEFIVRQTMGGKIAGNSDSEFGFDDHGFSPV